MSVVCVCVWWGEGSCDLVLWSKSIQITEQNFPCFFVEIVPIVVRSDLRGKNTHPLFVFVSVRSDNHQGSIGDKVQNDKNKNCGKIRDFVGQDGLALLRVADCVGKRSLDVLTEDGQKRAEGATHIPPWWPVETDEVMRQVTGRK